MKDFFKFMSIIFLIGGIMTTATSCKDDDDDDESTVTGEIMNPKDMIIEVETSLSVDDAVSQLKAEIESKGYTIVDAGKKENPIPLSKMVESKDSWKAWAKANGTDTALPSIKVIEYYAAADYKTAIASEDDYYASVMFPFIISVYEKDGGTVVAYMNLSEVGTYLGGGVATLASGPATDQNAILSAVLDNFTPYTATEPQAGFAADQMILEAESKYSSVDETLSALKASVETNGWDFFNGRKDLDYNKYGSTLGMDNELTICEICNPEYAGRILSVDESRFASVMMPCVITVYKKSDGKVYLAYMNAQMMGSMDVFGVQNITDVFVGKVHTDQQAILTAVANL